MINSQLYTAISEPRFLKYYVACKNNRMKALRLYRANIGLSQRAYAIIGVFEIILRNSIDRHFVSLKGNTWLEDAVQPGGYLNVNIDAHSFHTIHETIQRLGLEYTHDKLISRLTLGFWTYQFATKQYAAAGSTLLQIFPNRPFGMSQKTVFKNLMKINELRNRVAHYEPICFDKATGSISTDSVLRHYHLILELLHWLGCPSKKILYGIDNVPTGIKKINDICP